MDNLGLCIPPTNYLRGAGVDNDCERGREDRMLSPTSWTALAVQSVQKISALRPLLKSH